MAIVPAAFHRRLAQLWMLVLLLVVGGPLSAAAQTPVVAGSITPNTITVSQQIGQIYHLLVATNGDVLLLDTQNGALYEIQAGSTNLITLSGPGTVLRGNGAFWNSGMALDQWNNLYITGIYGPQPDFYRVPFDPTTNTWPLSGSSAWAAGNGLLGGLGVNQVAFLDGNGTSQTLVASTEADGEVVKFTIDSSGNVGTLTTLVTNLKAAAARLATDHSGNIFFIEEPYNSRTTVDVGVWMIPAGTNTTTNGAVSPLVRIDPPASGFNFKGMSVDAAGDLLFSSTIDTGGTSGGDGNFDGVLLVPNESGSPTTAAASSFNWSHATILSPVTATAPVATDPRGILWIPTSTSGWASIDSTETTPPAFPGTMNFAIYNLGSANLGASPLATAGSAATIYFSFNSTVTPSKIVFVQDGQTGSDFSVVTTNPIMNPATVTNPTPTVDTTVVPCKIGTTYTAGQNCPYWIALKPTAVGRITGQLQMLDASNNVIAKSAVNLFGQGQGAGIAILGSPAESTIGSSYNQPKQVAVDVKGNLYVADAAQGKVLEYASGSSTGVAIGTGITSPTGVAVDGTGNVYIGDSGKVFEVPLVAGALSNAGQTTLKTGLGNNLNLTVDGQGNVYIADKDKKQIVKLPTPTVASTILTGVSVTIGSGYTSPAAVTVDGTGNIFIADGTTLDEVSYWGAQTVITTQLPGTASGLAIDASGSVYVAGSTGLVRVPALSGALSINSATSIDTADVKSPTGVAIDRTGNLYVSYLNTSGVETVGQIGLNGSYNFGAVTPLVLTTGEAEIFNIGNLPLTFSAFSGDTVTGTTAADYSTQPPNDTPACSPSTATAVGAGCYFGFGVTPSILTGTETGVMSVNTNAGNTSAATLTLIDSPAVDNRPATTTTISPIAAVSYPGGVTVTVTVASTAGTPQGNVSISVNNNVGTMTAGLNASGVATFTLSNLGGGTYNVNATYKGYGVLGTAPDFAASAARQVTFTVNPATPTITSTKPPAYIGLNGSDTITVTVSAASGVPTGTISFMNGTALADPAQGPVALNGQGQATFNISALPLGTYSLTAVYSGDQNFAKSTVALSTFSIITPSVLITSSPASLTLKAGTPASVLLTLQGLVKYGGNQVAVNLSCDNKTLPKYSECSFSSPNVPILTSNGSAQVTLTINTNIPVNSGALRLPNSRTDGVVFAGVFTLGLLGLGLRRRKRFNAKLLTIVCVALLLGSAAGLVGCTNSGYTHTPPTPLVVTPSGTSNVSVIATDATSGKVVSIPFALPVTVQ